MVQRHYVNTKWEEFEALVTKLEGEKKPITVLFSGDKDEAGVSWCPYCKRFLLNLSINIMKLFFIKGNKAAPVIEEVLTNVSDER